jgi:hypothetical protein
VRIIPVNYEDEENPNFSIALKLRVTFLKTITKGPRGGPRKKNMSTRAEPSNSGLFNGPGKNEVDPFKHFCHVGLSLGFFEFSPFINPV